MPPGATDEARLLRLEEKVAYQDKLIAELNDVVVALHKQSDQMKARLGVLEATLKNELGPREAPNEKPPHY